MKIILVAPHLNLGNGGGSERQTIELANGLALKGCEITVLLTGGKGNLISELSGEVEVVLCDSRSNFFSQFAAIYKTAKAKKPDILYGRLWKIKPAMVAVGKILGIKTVAVEVNNIKEKRKLLPPVIRNAAGFAKYLCYKTTDSVITISEEGRKNIADLGIGDKAQTVHNGIDTDAIEKMSREKAAHRWFDETIPVAVAVGRLRPQKGYENLVDTVAETNKTTPLRLLIIGGGPLKNTIAEKAERLGVRDKIDFTGAVSNPHKYTAKCDIFVCSSLFEGFGLVLAEALALGMPVVSTNYKYGANEIVEDGKSGILVPVGDSRKMADAIVKLIQNKEIAAQMGEEAKNRAKYFSVEKMTEKTLRILETT